MEESRAQRLRAVVLLGRAWRYTPVSLVLCVFAQCCLCIRMSIHRSEGRGGNAGEVHAFTIKKKRLWACAALGGGEPSHIRVRYRGEFDTFDLATRLTDAHRCCIASRSSPVGLAPQTTTPRVARRGFAPKAS